MPKSLAALPTAERLPASLEAPLGVLSATPDGVFAVTTGEFKNKLLLTWSGSTLTILDLEIWSLFSTQPDVFLSEIADVGVSGDGVTVVVALTSGDIATFDLTDSATFFDTDDDTTSDDAEIDSRELDFSSQMDTAGITAMAVDPNSNTKTVYLIDQENEMYYEADIESENLEQHALGSGSSSEDEDDATTTDFTPTDIAFAAADSGDTIIITTTTGFVLTSAPGDFDFSAIELDVRSEDEGSPTLDQISITPDQDFAFIIDSDNDVIWIFGVSSNNFIDPIDGETSLDPIEFDNDDENTSLVSIAFLSDAATATVHGFVSGDFGISVFDATDPSEKADSKLIDIDDSTASIFDPITVSATPSLLVSLSDETLTLLSANGDASISVISDNPYVSLEGANTSRITEDEPTFTLTFQTDEIGTYQVFANSDPLQLTGTEMLTTTAIDTADTDTTTIEFDINDFARDTFVEGDNKFYVFVTDAEGNLGWDAVIVAVDRPPGAISIDSAAFGNKKIYVNFTPSEDADIDNYTLFAEPALNQSEPDCPGDLTFTSEDAVTDTVDLSHCDLTTCSAAIDGLTNRVAYCVAVRATDASEQEGEINGFNLSVTPEATVGPAEFLGETGCALHANTKPDWKIFVWLSLSLALPLFLRREKNLHRTRQNKKRAYMPLAQIILALFFVWGFAAHAHAKELTPQHWSYELRGTYWFPMRSEIQGFFDDCCNLLFENEIGFLPTPQFNITAGLGFGYRSSNAVGIDSGNASGDTFKMLLFPMHLDALYRFDYKEDQLLAPYIRVGLDSYLFREYGSNSDLWANKFGAHAGLGLGILLDNIEGLTHALEQEMGVNDVYLTLEGRYAFINSFSQTGMDFSGLYTSIGLLFEF